MDHPWRGALSYLAAAGLWEEGLKVFPEVSLAMSRALHQVIEKKLQTFVTTSAGRLFDAVSAICGIVRESSYEGHAAIELEAVLGHARPKTQSEGYSFSVAEKAGRCPLFEIDWSAMFKELLGDVQAGEQVSEMSRRFHDGLISGFTSVLVNASKQLGVSTVALSGGCFVNQYLVEGLTSELERAGLHVLRHYIIPPNDGGLALGQLVVADQVRKGMSSCVWQYR